jgi:hypothetical protein
MRWAALAASLFLVGCHQETRADSQAHLIAAEASRSSTTAQLDERAATTVTQGPSTTVIETYFPPAPGEVESPDAGVLPPRPNFYSPEHGPLRSRTVINIGPVIATSSSSAHESAAGQAQTHAREQSDSLAQTTKSTTVGPGWKLYLAVALVLCAAIYALYRWAPKLPFLRG